MAKYLGPCVICGVKDGYTGRYVRKMCKNCYARMRTTGNKIPTTKYLGPCVVCGSLDPGSTKYFNRYMCSVCYKKTLHREQNPLEIRYCVDCGEPIEPSRKRLIRVRCHRCAKRKYYLENRKQHHESTKRNRKTPKGKRTARMQSVRHRFLRNGMVSTLTADEWDEILIRYNHRCAYCGRASRKFEIDHIIPAIRGGGNTADNVVPACRRCNRSKGTFLLTDWYYGDH